MLVLDRLITKGFCASLLSPRQLVESLAMQTGVPMVSTHLCGSLPCTSPWGCVLATSGQVGFFRAV